MPYKMTDSGKVHLDLLIRELAFKLDQIESDNDAEVLPEEFRVIVEDLRSLSKGLVYV